MKAIKWLVVMFLIAMLALVACKDKDQDEGGAVPAQGESQTGEVMEESAPADSGEESGASEESASTAEEAAPEDAGETGAAQKPAAAMALLDEEAIVDRLGNYLLRPEDMPHKYKIPEGGEQRTPTIRLIQQMGEIEAKTYVKETGRIDGWWLKLERASKADFAPGTFESSIELFQTVDGARMAISPGYYALYQDENRQFTKVEGGCDLGDQCEFFYSEKEDPATELITAQYNVAFTYRNAFVWVMARGLQVDMDADYVLDAARAVFEKLKDAPTQ